MPLLPLVLPTASNIGRDGQVANTRLINAYAEQAGAGAKNQIVVYGAPGLSRLDDDSYIGASRGMIELNSNALIHFTGNQIISYDQGFVDTSIGTLVGSGKLHLAKNRKSTPQIGIVTSSGQVFSLESSAITQVTDTDLPTPNSICYLDGFFLYGIEDGRVFSSDLEEGTSIQADAFGQSNSDSSDLVRVYAHAGFLFIFRKEAIEIWQSDPSLAAENFVFSPVQQDIPFGCLAAHSIASRERGIIWVDNDGIVRFGRDGNAQRISSHTVERDIASLTASQQQDIEAFVYSFHGHQYYAISSASWTWEYDFTRGGWDERKSKGASRWLASSSEQFNSDYIVGSTNNGKLYKIDPDTHTEDDNELVAELWCAHSHNFPNAMIVDAFHLDIVAGVGQTSTDDELEDPKIMVDYSDDGGHNFEGERIGYLGKIGERKKSIRMNKWGKVDEPGRIWRIRSSAGVLRGFIQASLDARPAS